MYKVLIQTKHSGSLPAKTQGHYIFNFSEGSQVHEQPCLSIGSTIQLIGKIHLYRNLALSSGKVINYEKKSNQLLIVNANRTVFQILRQREMEIQIMYKIVNPAFFEQKNCPNIAESFDIVVIFKSIAISDEVHRFIKEQERNFNHIAIFYVSVIVVAIVHEFDTLHTNELKFNPLIDEQTEKQSWIQIPHCIQCLSILEPEITAIKQILSPTSKELSQSCLVCTTLKKNQFKCSQCSQQNDNWVCMICGVIGCGRYKNADAYKHYKTTKHILSLDLQTQRIWNYKLDCFSHRIQDKEEQKPQQIEDIQEQEMQKQFWKYCQVVYEQLERQRNFYNKIKQEQIESLDQQQKILQQKIREISLLVEQRKENTKKKYKKVKKVQKKREQLQQQIAQQRQLNRCYEENVKNRQLCKKSEYIEKKEAELLRLEQESSNILSSLLS